MNTQKNQQTCKHSANTYKPMQSPPPAKTCYPCKPLQSLSLQTPASFCVPKATRKTIREIGCHFKTNPGSQCIKQCKHNAIKAQGVNGLVGYREAFIRLFIIGNH